MIKEYNVPVHCVTYRLKAKRRKALLIGEKYSSKVKGFKLDLLPCLLAKKKEE